MNTLVVYVSKYGATQKCVHLLEENLIGEVSIMDLAEKNRFDLSLFDTVIIGGPIFMGKIHRKVSTYCNENLASLLEKRIGLFICGMAEGDALTKEIETNFPKELLDKAEVKTCFGGEFSLSKMGFLSKTIVKKVSKVTEDISSLREDAIHDFANVMNG